jgi:hypothetical protein
LLAIFAATYTALPKGKAMRMLVRLLMLVLRVVVLLVVFISCLGIQTLAVRVARLLCVYVYTSRTRLFRNRTRCRSRSWWRLKYGWIFVGLRNGTIIRTITIVLLPLWIRIIGIWERVALLRSLGASRLRLTSPL